MKAAIENFVKMYARAGTDGNGADKILMLGGMMELGTESVYEHQALIDLINKYNWKNVVLVGGDFNKTNHTYLNFENSEQAKEWFINQNFKHTNILIKGSRSTMMEKILE